MSQVDVRSSRAAQIFAIVKSKRHYNYMGKRVAYHQVPDLIALSLGTIETTKYYYTFCSKGFLYERY